MSNLTGKFIVYACLAENSRLNIFKLVAGIAPLLVRLQQIIIFIKCSLKNNNRTSIIQVVFWICITAVV